MNITSYKTEAIKEIRQAVWPGTLSPRIIEVIAAKYLELQAEFMPALEKIQERQQRYIGYSHSGRRPSKKFPLQSIPAEHRTLINRISLLKSEMTGVVNQLTELGYLRVDWVSNADYVERDCSLEEFETMKNETKCEHDILQERWKSAMKDLIGVATALAVEKVKETRAKLSPGLVERLDAITMKALPEGRGEPE